MYAGVAATIFISQRTWNTVQFVHCSLYLHLTGSKTSAPYVGLALSSQTPPWKYEHVRVSNAAVPNCFALRRPSELLPFEYTCCSPESPHFSNMAIKRMNGAWLLASGGRWRSSRAAAFRLSRSGLAEQAGRSARSELMRAWTSISKGSEQQAKIPLALCLRTMQVFVRQCKYSDILSEKENVFLSMTSKLCGAKAINVLCKVQWWDVICVFAIFRLNLFLWWPLCQYPQANPVCIQWRVKYREIFYLLMMKYLIVSMGLAVF